MSHDEGGTVTVDVELQITTQEESIVALVMVNRLIHVA